VTLSANAAIVSADSNGNIVSWNRGAQTVFGYCEGEILGKPLTTIMPERYRQRHETAFRRSQAGGELSRLKPIEFHGLRKDGAEFPLELSLSSWQTDEGTFHTGIIQDITARKQAEEEVLRLNARMREWIRDVEDANRELEAFSYSVSHDLRAPLRALDGYSRIALESLDSQPTDESRRYLGLIRKNAQQMGHLIDDLLNFSRLGRQSLTMQPVAVADVVRRVLTDLRSECEDRSVDISLGDLPPCRADQALLRQVYANLVGNALKYTRHKDKAVIEIGALPANGEPDKQVYFVKDNGVGFDMAYAGKLFGVFQRLHRAEDYEGTGVGLATVKRIIQRHGGRIWAVAAVNAGATFFFTLQQETAA
jgi:PAS domain S-box-containing protein